MSQQAVGSKFKKNKVIEDQAQADTSKSDHEHSNDLATASDAVPAAALGGSKAFAAMLSEAQGAAGASAEAAKAGGAAAASGAAAGGGISSGLLIAGGLGILGGVAAAVGGGKGGSSTPTPPANQVPAFSAAEVAVSVDEDKPLNNSVKATDGNGDALTYAVGTKPANGTVAVNADGTYVYTPNANYSGADSFTVSVSDGKGGTATQTVKVTVNPVNDAPAFAAAELTPAAFSEDSNLVGSVKATDAENDTLSYAVGTRPANGSVTVNADGSYVYTPNANYNGTDSFTVTASDGKGGSATQTVKLTINPVNDAPVVSGPVTAPATEDGAAVTVNGLAKASDVDAGTTLSVTNVGTLPAGVTQSGNSFTLDPANAAYQSLAAGETKTVTVNYSVTDGVASTAASAAFTLTGTNDGPVVTSSGQAGAVKEDVTLSVSGTVTSSDVDNGHTAAYSGNKTGAYGTFSVNSSTGAWQYALDNANHQDLDEGETKTETFTVTVTDDKGATATQNVVISVVGTNDLPVVSATADTSVTFQEAAPAAAVASSQFVKVAGTDIDGGVVTFTIPTQPTYGNITLASDGSGFTYTPKDINYHGTETIVVRLLDPQGNGKYTDYPVTVNVTSNTAENQAIDNGLTKATYDAAGSGYTAGDNFTFIDDSAQTTNVEIVNFAAGDKIQVSASASKYSFAVTGAGDLEITYIDNASGASNVILVKGVAANAGFIYDETTAEAQLGLGNFFVSLADGASNAAGTTVGGTSLDVDSDSNVNTFALFNASAGNIAYTDDAAQANRALIQGFGAGDTITVSNAALSAYSFARDTNAGNDVVITYNNGGTINEIVLQGVAVGATGPLDTLSAVEALVGAGFFKSTSSGTGGSGGTFTPTATQIIDNASGISTYNAGTSSVKFTDDAGVRSDVVLQNFGSDDRIFTNTALNNYSFYISDTDSKDLVITFNNNLVPNQIVLDEILAGKDVFIDNYDSAKAAIGFDFMVFG